MPRELLAAICLTCAVMFTWSPAEAQVAWFGWSELCFEGKLKTGSVTDGEFTVEVTGTIRALCDNVQNAEDKCQLPGETHGGRLTTTVPASADPFKEKGFIYFDGCIPADKYDDHSRLDHEHLCGGSPWNIEVPGTAHMPVIETKWFLTSKGKVNQSGRQLCNWTGEVDVDTCSITHDVAYDCVVDEVFKK